MAEGKVTAIEKSEYCTVNC